MRFENTNIQIFYDTAKKLGIPVRVLQKDPPKLSLRLASKTHVIARKSIGLNPLHAIELAHSKFDTLKILKKHGLPVLKYTIIYSIEEYQNKSKDIGFPQVIKPAKGEKGKFVFLNVRSPKEGKKAVNQVFPAFKSALIESYFQSKDYRFCVLGGKTIGVAQRIPPQVTGDGKHNVHELIEIENEKRFKENQRIGRRMLNRMRRWGRIEWYLESQGKSFTDIPKKGEKVIVYPLPNFSTGGSVKTIPFESVHPSLIKLAEKAAQALGLTICGVDILIKDLKKPVSSRNSVIIELNSDPGIRLHEWPNEGRSQPVTTKILHFIAKKHSSYSSDLS